MKRPINLLQLFALVLALCHVPVAVAGAGYGFASVKAYLEARNSDMTAFQNRFENDLIQNLDDANAINIKYRTAPPEYVLYRLNLAKEIEASSKKPEKLTALCQNFIFIDGAEKDFNAKIQAYNENMAEKFIPRELYQVMDDDALREVLVSYLSTNNFIYGFKNPETLKIKIENSVPYKTEDGDFGVLYTVHVIEKNVAAGASPKSSPSPSTDSAATATADTANTDAGAATYTQDRLYQASYHNGEIVNFEQATDDAADLAVLKLCGKVQ